MADKLPNMTITSRGYDKDGYPWCYVDAGEPINKDGWIHPRVYLVRFNPNDYFTRQEGADEQNSDIQ